MSDFMVEALEPWVQEHCMGVYTADNLKKLARFYVLFGNHRGLELVRAEYKRRFMRKVNDARRKIDCRG